MVETNIFYDVIVIGGGPAGLAAACKAWETGARRVLVLERDKELGGILNQCIHNGFGLHYFKEELTGPEYAERFITMLHSTAVEICLDTMVLDLVPSSVAHDAHTVHVVSASDGYRALRTHSLVLAMGCRERTRGAVTIPGTRPAGIFTAGAAQRYVNMEGYMVGRRVLILGSGDIGLIMARRMTLEGAKVLACVELMPYSGGLTRNIVQCLEDYSIPLYLSHTIVEIRGEKRVEQAVVARVDENRRPIPGSEICFDCDTILLSVGLIPENEVTRGAGIAIDSRTNGAYVYENMETSLPGVFACGNAVHVHDLVDFVTVESQRAGAAAARYALAAAAALQKPVVTVESKSISPAPPNTNGTQVQTLTLANGTGVGYTVPQRIRVSGVEKSVDIFFRVRGIYTESEILVQSGTALLARFPRDHMTPGEMEHITLPKLLLERADIALPLTVSVHAHQPDAAQGVVERKESIV